VRFTVVLERALTTRPLLGSDGVVYLGGDNRVYALSATGQMLWERRLHARDDLSNPVARLEPTPVGIAGSADRTFLIPVAMSAEVPRSFAWKRVWD
jgi:outer membrane protein assembly factor BamB